MQIDPESPSLLKNESVEVISAEITSCSVRSRLMENHGTSRDYDFSPGEQN